MLTSRCASWAGQSHLAGLGCSWARLLCRTIKVLTTPADMGFCQHLVWLDSDGVAVGIYCLLLGVPAGPGWAGLGCIFLLFLVFFFLLFFFSTSFPLESCLVVCA